MGRRLRGVFARVPVMSAAKLQECLGVELSDPVFAAALSVLRGLEEQERERVAVTRGDELARAAARMSMAGEAQAVLLEIAERGRRARAHLGAKR